MPKKAISLGILLILIIVISVFLTLQSEQQALVLNTNNSPATTSNPVTTQKDPVVLDDALPSKISNPLIISGKALGTWFFEASFPVKLVDANGKVLAETPAQAHGEWMTTEPVAFSATLVFATPSTPTGKLVFEKDNPSGLPENDARFSIPVTFATSTSQKMQTVKLYYPNSVKADELGDACSRDSVIVLNRDIPKTDTPIKDTINTLISGMLTDVEKEQGFSTEFPNTNFKLVSANLKNGTLTLEFSDPNNFTSGGSCRVLLLAEQITKTAKQFSGVSKVVLKPDTLFQP